MSKISMNAVSILILLIVFQLTVFSVFLFGRKTSNRFSSLLLGAFFLSLAINLLNALCFRVPVIFAEYTHYFYIGAPFSFLLGPLFYIYARSITEEKFSFNPKEAIHFLPFLMFTIFLLIKFYFHSAEWKRHYLLNEGVLLWKVLMPLLNIQIILYAVVGLKILRDYKKKIKDVYSCIEEINYSWVKFMFYGLLFLWFADLARYFTMMFKSNQWGHVEIFFFSGFLVFSYLILYKVITQPAIFSPVFDVQQKKKKSLSENVNRQYLDQLMALMENEKPYLNPSLTLFDVSSMTGIPPRSLSDVINSSLNKNFYDFINSFRIKEAEALLAESHETKKTILEILYQVGFNTKSSFNQAFKKHSGITPTQFKKQQLQLN